MTASGQKIGYARVSTTGQNLDSQMDALKEFGCVKVFTDKGSSVLSQRQGFEKLVEYLREGDILVITELSRMTRSLKHLLTVVEDFEKSGIHLVSLRENIDTKTATGRCFLSIVGAIAQMERELKRERTQAGREAAKARGRTGGRPKTNPQKLQQARILYENSDQSATQICKAVGIGRRTLFYYLAQERNAKQKSIPERD